MQQGQEMSNEEESSFSGEGGKKGNTLKEKLARRACGFGGTRLVASVVWFRFNTVAIVVVVTINV